MTPQQQHEKLLLACQRLAGSDHTGDADELLGRADKRLYRAKRGGRNRVEAGE